MRNLNFIKESIRVYAEGDSTPFLVGETTKTTRFSPNQKTDSGETESQKESNFELRVQGVNSEIEKVRKVSSSGEEVTLYFQSENGYIETSKGRLEDYLPLFTLILKHSEPIRLTEEEMKEFFKKIK